MTAAEMIYRSEGNVSFLPFLGELSF